MKIIQKKNSTSTPILALLIFLFSSISISEKNNFSGTWEINVKESYLGGLPINSAAPATIKVAQTDTSINVEKTYNGDSPLFEELNFNGRKVQSVLKSGAKKEGFVKWSDDNRALVFIGNYQVSDSIHGNWQYSKTETWHLSEDQKSLIIEKVTIVPNRKDSVRAVYDRK